MQLTIKHSTHPARLKQSLKFQTFVVRFPWQSLRRSTSPQTGRKGGCDEYKTHETKITKWCKNSLHHEWLSSPYRYFYSWLEIQAHIYLLILQQKKNQQFFQTFPQTHARFGAMLLRNTGVPCNLWKGSKPKTTSWSQRSTASSLPTMCKHDLWKLLDQTMPAISSPKKVWTIDKHPQIIYVKKHINQNDSDRSPLCEISKQNLLLWVSASGHFCQRNYSVLLTML